MKKHYRFGFEIWGLILFLIIMIPNFIWFAVPAPNDVLRADSVTIIFDTIASICQVIMIISLCALVNRNAKKLGITRWIVACSICYLLYFISWIFYYIGITNVGIILGLTIPPCLTFLFFAIDRKNIIAIVPIVIFTICHFIHGIVNFVI